MDMKKVTVGLSVAVTGVTAVLVGGCASIRDEPCYIPGGSYVRSWFVPRGGYVEGGRRYYYDGNRRYYEDSGRRYYIDELRREAREEREFIKDVGKTQMKMQRDAAQMQMKAAQAEAKMQMDAVKVQAKMQQQAAKTQMKAAARMMKK